VVVVKDANWGGVAPITKLGADKLSPIRVNPHSQKSKCKSAGWNAGFPL